MEKPILIWTCQTANNTADILNITDCIDAEVEFPPHNMWLESLAVRDLDLNGKSAFIYNYQCLVDYEVKIPAVAWEVQVNVKNEIEQMTGLSVTAVNIHVQGVHLPDEEEL